MKKIIFVCGIIAGLIVSGMMFFSVDQCYQTGNFEHGMIYGYTGMLIAFSCIFVGIKIYRDKYNNKLISFGKAFKIGLFITLIASTFYVVSWLISYYNFYPDFAESYAKHVLNQAKAAGASEAEMVKQTAEMARFKEMYKNPVFVILMTYVEILPIGLVVALISSLILKRKTIKQAAE